GDYVPVVPAGASQGVYRDYEYTSNGSPAKIGAPEEPGDCEVRYVTGQSGSTLATAPITVTEATATVSAPSEVGAGSDLEVDWTGPGNDGDYITIVPAGSPEGTYLDYEYATSGSPVSIRAPDPAGDYEVRYVTQAGSTLASTPVSV